MQHINTSNFVTMKTFITKHGLNKHVKAVHRTGEPLKCEHCDKVHTFNIQSTASSLLLIIGMFHYIGLLPKVYACKAHEESYRRRTIQMQNL